MKIISLIATLHDGDTRIHVAATRAPDLLRRQLSAQTGHATLVAVALAPTGLSPEALLATVDRRLAESRVAPGIYAVAPGVVIRALAEATVAFHLRTLSTAARSRIRRRLRRLQATVTLVIRSRPRTA